jgi:23S rRNA (uracil1939-C5)-methyltransferase
MARQSRKPGGKKPAQRRSVPRPGARFSAGIDAMASGGHGLARHAGQVVFIPYTIPGEAVDAEWVRSAGQVGYARGLRLTAASGDRVRPVCVHFHPGGCWGCQWQHIAYDAQCALKTDLLTEALLRGGAIEEGALERVLQDIVPAPTEWGYDHQMVLRPLGDGTFGMAGEGRGDPPQWVPVSACQTAHSELVALQATLALDFPGLRSLRLVRGSDGATMIVLALDQSEAPEIDADFPTSVNAILPDNEPLNLIGAASVSYAVRDRQFRATAGSFFRPNLAQIPALVDAVLDALALRGDEAVLELYGGVGVLSAFLAEQASILTMVESFPPAMSDADVNLAAFVNVDLIEGAAAEVLADILEAGAQYDLVVADPPASGLDTGTRAALLALRPPRLLLVSSQPASLARDLRALLAAGYVLQRMQPLDFAPQTYRVTAIALLALPGA